MSNPAKALQFGLRLEPHPLSLFSCHLPRPPPGRLPFSAEPRSGRPNELREANWLGFAKQKGPTLLAFSACARCPPTFRGSVRYAQAGEHAELLNRQFQPNQVFKFANQVFKTRNCRWTRFCSAFPAKVRTLRSSAAIGPLFTAVCDELDPLAAASNATVRWSWLERPRLRIRPGLSPSSLRLGPAARPLCPQAGGRKVALSHHGPPKRSTAAPGVWPPKQL